MIIGAGNRLVCGMPMQSESLLDRSGYKTISITVTCSELMLKWFNSYSASRDNWFSGTCTFIQILLYNSLPVDNFLCQLSLRKDIVDLITCTYYMYKPNECCSNSLATFHQVPHIFSQHTKNIYIFVWSALWLWVVLRTLWIWHNYVYLA